MPQIVVVGNRSPRWLEAEDMGYRTFFIELMCSGSVMGTLENAFFARDLPDVIIYNGKGVVVPFTVIIVFVFFFLLHLLLKVFFLSSFPVSSLVFLCFFFSC